jgi:hypothetical protein
MPTPPKDVLCDAPGCGRIATLMTDGTEKDTHPDAFPVVIRGHEHPAEMSARPALAKVYVCERHRNFPHSNDQALRIIAASDAFQKRTL